MTINLVNKQARLDDLRRTEELVTSCRELARQLSGPAWCETTDEPDLPVVITTK